jgi:hypothetical protein
MSPRSWDNGSHLVGLHLEPWLRRLHLADDITVQEGVALEWWIRSRKTVPKPIRRGFDFLFLLIRWERNARTFNRVATSAAQLGIQIREEADAWCLAGFIRKLKPLCWHSCSRVYLVSFHCFRVITTVCELLCRFGNLGLPSLCFTCTKLFST